MSEKLICAGCKKSIGPRQGYSFDGLECRHAKEKCDPAWWAHAEDPNKIKINFHLQCRGRNGRFCAKEIEVWRGPTSTFVSVFSKQRYGEAPIQLEGANEHMVALFRGILGKLEEGPLGEREESPSGQGRELYRRHIEIERRGQ